MILINGKSLVTDSVFSGGELNIRLPDLDLKMGDSVTIDYRSKNPLDLLKLGLIVNAIYSNYHYLGNTQINLNIPYLPYGRQDRVCKYGEPFSLNFVYSYLISLGFYSINTVDIHSNVIRKLHATNVRTTLKTNDFINTTDFISKFYELNFPIENLIRVSPDKGALGRIKEFKLTADKTTLWYDFYEFYKKTPILEVEKERIDGDVKSTIKTLLPVKNCNLLIIDDICDGGATFIDLARQLSKCDPKSITLFVTHGIFRNGTSDLYDAGITRIITTDSLPQTLTNHKGEFHVFKV